jgi:hypothetical protein
MYESFNFRGIVPNLRFFGVGKAKTGYLKTYMNSESCTT